SAEMSVKVLKLFTTTRNWKPLLGGQHAPEYPKGIFYGNSSLAYIFYMRLHILFLLNKIKNY
ncbi:hypothetical protein AAKU52_003186, partial [Pedobacter sp. CG_S7]|uniref:hypothetical protein n=1 Tax=Pedobacter sp. CG_S7 TaxID=3143930 RepID=UPI0033996EFD